MFLCRRWRTNWWRCAGSSMFAFPSRSLKCPRSHLHPVIAGAVCALLSRRQKQLVEVPTIISYSSLLQRTAEQIVVIPVPDRGGRNVGLQGFPPRQSSTAQLASQKRSSEQIVEQIVARFFLGWTFPRVKKSPEVSPHSGSELSADFNPSTLSAHRMAPPDERTSMVDANGHAWVRLDTARGSYWQNLDTGHQQWRPPWEH